MEAFPDARCFKARRIGEKPSHLTSAIFVTGKPSERGHLLRDCLGFRFVLRRDPKQFARRPSAHNVDLTSPDLDEELRAALRRGSVHQLHPARLRFRVHATGHEHFAAGEGGMGLWGAGLRGGAAIRALISLFPFAARLSIPVEDCPRVKGGGLRLAFFQLVERGVNFSRGQISDSTRRRHRINANALRSTSLFADPVEIGEEGFSIEVVGRAGKH